jgi:hypothetical protein
MHVGSFPHHGKPRTGHGLAAGVSGDHPEEALARAARILPTVSVSNQYGGCSASPALVRNVPV